MGVSQEYIQRQQALAALVQQYKADGIDHNTAWKKAEQLYDSGQWQPSVSAIQNGTWDSATSAPQAQSTQTTAAVDPSGSYASTGSQSVRYRGSTSQSRVGGDTRVRGGVGDVGEETANMGTAMQQAANEGKEVAAPVTTQNVSWQATRQPTDLASVRQRVLQSVSNNVRGAQ